MIKKIAKKYADNSLEEWARRWLNSNGAEGYDNGAAGAYEDLQRGGCASGMVGELVYTRDAVRFYRRFAKIIDPMLADLLSDVGGSVSGLFSRAGWDESDPLAREDGNQNILAWFGMEEAARRVYERAEAGQ